MKLLSFGEIIWDVYPEEKTLGGAPLNLAAHAALLGDSAVMCSAIGADASGEEALAAVAALGIGTAGICVADALETGRCDVTLDASGKPSYALLCPAAYDRLTVADEIAADADVLAFGTLALRMPHNRETISALIARHTFSHIYSDLNIRPPFYDAESVLLCLSSADIVKISDEELPTVTELVFGRPVGIAESAALLFDRFPGMEILLITCGGEGAYCYRRGEGEPLFRPAMPTTVVSTVGAGDSFGAAFLSRYCRGDSIADCLDTAVRISAHVVGCREAIPTDMREFVAQI